MALNENKNLKLYYNIGEVAKMFGVNESTLRYWEQEFPQIKPKTSWSVQDPSVSGEGYRADPRHPQSGEGAGIQVGCCQEDTHSES